LLPNFVNEQGGQSFKKAMIIILSCGS